MKKIINKFLLAIFVFALFVQSTMAMTQSEVKDTLFAALDANNKKQYATSIELSQKVLKAYPKNYQALCILGLAYAGKGDTMKAVDVLSKASATNPDEWSANSFLGDIYMHYGSYYVAKKYYEKVLANPKLTDAEKTYFQKQVTNCQKKLSEQSNAKTLKINVKIPFTVPADWSVRGVSKTQYGWAVEYGYKNENITNDKWTKLVTVNYFKSMDINVNDYYLKTMKFLNDYSVSLHRPFKYNLISKSDNEVIYEWNLGNGQECEISRVVQVGKEVYHLHYAQKSAITKSQRDEWLKVFEATKIIPVKKTAITKSSALTGTKTTPQQVKKSPLTVVKTSSTKQKAVTKTSTTDKTVTKAKTVAKSTGKALVKSAKSTIKSVVKK